MRGEVARARAAIGGREVAKWVERLARLGYLAKGIVYGLVGVLAAQLAFGTGGEVTGTRGAIREIGEGTFGQLALVLIALGLLGYAAWRLVQGFLDVDGKGDDAEGLIKRAGYVGSAVIHASLAFFAASIALGDGGSGGAGGGGGDRARSMTAEILSHTGGAWLVGLAGLITIGVGLYQFYLGYEVEFTRHWKMGEMRPAQRTWGVRAGRFGLMARGVVFGLMGVFFLQAARQSDASEVKGLGGVLAEIASQGYGTWLLGIVALGLVAYAVYCFVQARYRYFQVRASGGAPAARP